MIIRNTMGEVMVALSARGLSVMDSEEAEVLACRRAMEFAMEIGFWELVLEGDNVTVRKALLSPRATCCRLGHIYGDINVWQWDLETSLLVVSREVPTL